MGSPELALWTTVRHVNKLVAPHATDAELRRAYELVIHHAQGRVDYYLRTASNVACPPLHPNQNA
jgi:hypothetical protein